ncbi:MAG: hypothetical protein JXR97_08535 [Planctomycetes bacterium]|nr:hypothetical protein [Planctomycetota bacterium]
MITVKLTDEEAESLEELMKGAISEMHTEISHTTDRSYKDMLKKRKAFFGRFVNDLREQRTTMVMHAVSHEM